MEAEQDHRTKAEIARIEAEAAKLLAERNEIEKRLNERWYTGRYFIQAVIAGIAASGLIVGWVKTQLEPILTAKNDRAAIEIEVGKKSNELEALRNQISQEKLRKELSELSRNNQDLLQQQEQLRRLAESKTQALQEKKSDRAEVKNELAVLQTQLQQLKEAKAITEQRAKGLEATLGSQFGTLCVTAIGPCPMYTPHPEGSPCYCVTSVGPQGGVVRKMTTP